VSADAGPAASPGPGQEEDSPAARLRFSSHGRPWMIVLRPTPRGKAIDRFIVRWTGFSPMTYQFAKAGRVPYHKPHLLLTTIGSKSGQLRTSCLPYFSYGDYLVVCGSKGGGPRNPFWSSNIKANPQCWIRINRRLIPAVGRIAEGDEREKVFAVVAEQHRGLRRYQEQTSAYGRDVPLVLLTPRTDPAED
jgi:deazaflavin-dependent oxidoreductase (nitroreductase family)